MDERDYFYIYSPAWVHWSAGIRVLHYLCDLLNRNGFNAFLVLHGEQSESETFPGLLTPVLNRQILKTHKQEARRIVAIYPEGIPGNPLNAQYVIRWILNYPSLLGGSTNFQDEVLLAYSKELSTSLEDHSEILVLFVPALKSSEFEENVDVPVSEPIKMQIEPYELIYAQKFRALGGELPPLKKNQIEITRFGSSAPTRAETLLLLRNASLVHVFENTTIITESLLYGVPVLCHENAFFKSLIAEFEMPMRGISWSSSEIVKTDRTYNLQILRNAESSANNSIKKVFANIELISKRNINNSRKLKLPNRGIFTYHSISRAKIIYKQKGMRVLIRFFLNYISRGN